MSNVKLDQLIEHVEAGMLAKWLKNVGEFVGKDEPFVEIITNKVNMEMLSDFEGELTEILVEEGQTVEVGQVICRMIEKVG
jgi:pyruvate/2-oxoglutarate dehydrogenase complex dihydrolipoamide acyltransferase (E2) component